MPPKYIKQPMSVNLAHYTDAELRKVELAINGVSESILAAGDLRRYGAISGTADSSAAFNAALDKVGDNGVVIVIGSYRISNIDLISNRVIDIRNGTLELTDPDTYMFKAAENIDNITFIGGVLNGRIADASPSGANKYGFWGAGCSNISFIDTVFDSFHEDGITLFEGSTVVSGGYRTPCRNIRLSNVWIRRCGRNAMSIVNAKGVYGKFYCSESNDPHSYFIGPWAGVDIEPDNLNTLSDIDIEVDTWDNAGSGVAIYGLAVDVFESGNIRIKHNSKNDLRGFRLGRWVDRSVGAELSVNYNGSIQDPSGTHAIMIDTIGGGISLDLKATVLINNSSKFLVNMLKESPGGTYSNTPRLRCDIAAIGEIDDLFTNQSIGQIMSFNTVIKIDATALTVTAVGGQDNYAGRLEVVKTTLHPFENARTATGNVIPVNVAFGERVNSNSGATGAITLTLQNANFLTGQEAEFYVAAAQNLTIAISDNTKKILGYNDFEIITNIIGSRIRLKKESSGDWKVVSSPRGQAFNWAAT